MCDAKQARRGKQPYGLSMGKPKLAARLGRVASPQRFCSPKGDICVSRGRQPAVRQKNDSEPRQRRHHRDDAGVTQQSVAADAAHIHGLDLLPRAYAHGSNKSRPLGWATGCFALWAAV